MHFYYLTPAQQAALWTWDPADQANMATMYRLRDPEIAWKLPKVTPVLPSGDDLETRCGPLRYDIVTLNTPDYITLVNSTNYQTALEMKI